MNLIKALLRCIFNTTNVPARHATDTSGIGDRELAISHAKDGYKNAQEIIRFVDTKSTFLAGACVVAIGATLEKVKQYLELPNETKKQLGDLFQDHPYCALGIKAMMLVSLLAGVLCLWSCVFSLVGRPPKRDMNHIQTVLFPFFTGMEGERGVTQKVFSGMTTVEVAIEYENQLWNVGVILNTKIKRHRWAAWMFLIQIASLVAGGIIVLLCTGL